MTTWSGGRCEVNGVGVHYLRTGGALPPVVALHGLLGSGACWTPLARALQAEFDVVMPDARGHGGSGAPRSGYRYDDLADDVVGLIRTLELSRPVVIGHSMGGLTAGVVAARAAVTLRGLVLVDPTFVSPARQRQVYDSGVVDQHRRLLGLSRSELVAQSRSRHPQRSPELVEIQAEARLSTRLAAFEVLRPPNPDYREVVAAIDVPSLLVIGDRPVVSPQTAAHLRTLNPRLQVEQVAAAGHGLPFDQPERLSEIVLSFLRRIATGHPPAA